MTRSTSFRQLIILALTAVLFMAFVPVTIKWISANEITIGIVRLVIATVGIATILAFSRKPIRLKSTECYWLILLGFVFAAHWYTYFKSIKLSDASLAAVGVATYGIHLLLLNGWLNKEKFALVDYVAIAISLLGIYLTMPNLDFSNDKVLGFVIAIFSGFLYACLPLINRRLPSLSTNTRALGQFGFALLFFSLFLPYSQFSLPAFDWLGLIFIGLFSTLIGHTFWLKASTELPSNITAVLYYCYVPLAMLMGYFFLNEPMSFNKVLGASLIIAANVMVAMLHKQKVKRLNQ